MAGEWAGEPVFVLAGGPSVKTLDVSLLTGHRVIAINSAWKTYPKADVLFYGDSKWWRQFGEDTGAFAGEIVTPAVERSARAIRRKKAKPAKGLAERLGEIAMEKTSVSGAIGEAVLRGAEPVFLLGLDGKLGKGGERHHHGENYPWPLRAGCFDLHAAEFGMLAPSLEAAGVQVFNVNPDSAINVWPKITFEEALSMAGAALALSEPVASKPPLVVRGMFGMGDCLHSRAILRELMKDHDVTVETYQTAMYHDLVADGLRLHLLDGRKAVIRDAGNGVIGQAIKFDRRITYDGRTVKANGSILAAAFAAVGLRMPAQPDFSLPVPAEWRVAARKLVGETTKPLLLYRPVVINKNWACPARSPDVEAYAALYQSVRTRFFVVSVSGGEEIEGPEQDADLKLHKGEASFEELAGLFAEADLVFGNAGFTPILAQAVGTPLVCVYGGHESFRTTNSVGAHLAPTLAIEPVKPCECHDRYHKCEKAIDLPVQIERLSAFVDQVLAGGKTAAPKLVETAKPRVLLFGTTYVDTEERLRLTRQWATLHRYLNADCDLMLVDSASPLLWCEDGSPQPGVAMPDVPIWAFADNIGHLSRNGPDGPGSRGRDGWGRAFCRGLQYAVEGGYDFAVHIEGDSLFRLPVMPIVEQMRRTGTKVATVPVEGTRRKEVGWVETGLMFFDVGWLKKTGFIERYDWPNRQVHPTPEKVIFNLVGKDLAMMPWKAERGDKSQITIENVRFLDWVTHCHGRPEVYDRFVQAVMDPKPLVPPTMKLNFGCGKNRITGWDNFDAEVDISQPLPFEDSSADLIFAEHVVEHIGPKQAVGFFEECLRVLKPGGVVRICVPSIENIHKRADQAYFNFVHRNGWSPKPDLRGAMRAIIYQHGHEDVWTQSRLELLLFAAGFEQIEACEPGKSKRAELVGVEGHGRVIGERMNWIEAAVAEAVRP